MTGPVVAQPSHPNLFRIHHQPGSFASSLKAVKHFAPGEVICRIEGTAPGPKRYSSVQISENDHIELQSDLLYMNHSCDPNTIVDVSSNPWVVRAIKSIERENSLTFAYFSTEWDMAQPFDCLCGSKDCLGTIKGAKDLPQSTLDRYFINSHILQLKSGQIVSSKTNGHTV